MAPLFLWRLDVKQNGYIADLIKQVCFCVLFARDGRPWSCYLTSSLVYVRWVSAPTCWAEDLLIEIRKTTFLRFWTFNYICKRQSSTRRLSVKLSANLAVAMFNKTDKVLCKVLAPCSSVESGRRNSSFHGELTEFKVQLYGFQSSVQSTAIALTFDRWWQLLAQGMKRFTKRRRPTSVLLVLHFSFLLRVLHNAMTQRSHFFPYLVESTFLLTFSSSSLTVTWNVLCSLELPCVRRQAEPVYNEWLKMLAFMPTTIATTTSCVELTLHFIPFGSEVGGEGTCQKEHSDFKGGTFKGQHMTAKGTLAENVPTSKEENITAKRNISTSKGNTQKEHARSKD